MSKEHDKVKEIRHVKQALKANNYPDWMLINNTGHWIWFESPNKLVTRREWYASVPYIKATWERLQRPFKSHEVTLVHEPFNSLRSQLVRVEDKTENWKKVPDSLWHPLWAMWQRIRWWKFSLIKYKNKGTSQLEEFVNCSWTLPAHGTFSIF